VAQQANQSTVYAKIIQMMSTSYREISILCTTTEVNTVGFSPISLWQLQTLQISLD